MNPVTRISPVSDAAAARMAGEDALAELASLITSTPAAGAPGRARHSGRARVSARRRLLVGVPVAAALAVAGLLASSLGSPGAKVGPVAVGPPKAQAAVLAVTRHDGYLDVIVKNPMADASRYRAEFRKLGLNITLTLVPASPSLVGTLVYFESPSSIQPITAVGKCYTGGGGSACPVGVKVPLNFKGSAVLTFGRPARPGEPYETTAPVTAPGEAMHGMTFIGQTADEVIAMLSPRHVTVGDYRYENAQCEGENSKSMPGNWYVTGADPWAPGQVALDVSKTWPAASCTGVGQPGAQPTPSPTAG